jgi:hypothetical protein
MQPPPKGRSLIIFSRCSLLLEKRYNASGSGSDFIRAITYDTSSKAITGRMGPKISSRMMGSPQATSSKMVGAI